VVLVREPAGSDALIAANNAGVTEYGACGASDALNRGPADIAANASVARLTMSSTSPGSLGLNLISSWKITPPNRLAASAGAGARELVTSPTSTVPEACSSAIAPSIAPSSASFE
jgi:hypothetical protein